MKRLLAAGISALIGVVLLFAAAGELIKHNMPPYLDSIGDDNYIEKITGLYLVEQSAKRDSNIIIYGSSELRTLNISTHPANFFRGQRNGIQVNLVGRGSCQSLIHAINIAATGDALTGKKVMLITSPQSYVRDGIAPDLFMANFSEQQYLTLMLDDSIPDHIKQYISGRVAELTGRYNDITGSSMHKYDAVGAMTEIASNNSLTADVLNIIMRPYYRFSKWLFDLRDLIASKKLIENVAEKSQGMQKAGSGTGIDWESELRAAVAEAEKMTDNNEFGMLNDYYTTYIGRKLNQQKNKDKDLSYSVSKEYDDLEILLEICKLKGIEPLFVHVPLHGEWSDYTGFTKEQREQYYQNVRDIVGRYENVTMIDLTGYEYEKYFLCDVMHLGWKGWLEVDKAIERCYREN
ncbi:MAG: D-alanyl-lipoteichoic acid biosynthesis protein DltD [Clostridiales bacterium]|nr:D-alanyl-lipoteichoic acid biosynthesis protein DltD [Clostridiales bacterium]